MPDGMDVKVVENADNTAHITLPMAPDGHEEMSMEELSNVAGGASITMQSLEPYLGETDAQF